jgi:hypothetical protein
MRRIPRARNQRIARKAEHRAKDQQAIRQRKRLYIAIEIEFARRIAFD